MDDGVQIDPDWDLAAQPAPDYEVNQRTNWRCIKAVISQALLGGLRVQQTQIHLSTSGLAFKLPRPLKPPRSKAPGRPKPM